MNEATVRGYLPGKREAAVFGALALLGLVAWRLSTPSVAGSLLGERFYRAAYSFPFYFGLTPYASLAFLAGFFFPRGFWLWGAALLSLAPFANAALAWILESRGAHVIGDGPAAALAYAVTVVALAIGFALMATIVSALGAGLRVLPWVLGALEMRRRAGGGTRR